MGAVMGLRAVIFDWGGTLTPWHSVDPEEQWRVFARQVYAQEDHAASLAARILAAEEAAWGRSRTEHSSARLHEILADAGFEEGDLARVAALKAVETTPFFKSVRATTLMTLYASPLAYAYFGYEGEAFSKGGYLLRGFNDLRWLPEVPLADGGPVFGADSH